MLADISELRIVNNIFAKNEKKLEQENKQLKEQEWQHQQVLAREMSMGESLRKDRNFYKELSNGLQLACDELRREKKK